MSDLNNSGQPDGGHIPAEEDNLTPEATPAETPTEPSPQPVADPGDPDATPEQQGAAFRRSHHSTPLIVGALIVGLIGGAASGAGTSALFYGSGNGGSSTSTSADNNSGAAGGSTEIKTTPTLSQSALSKVINSKLSSVVTIGVVGSSESGTGSGVVINDAGYIVTNAHVATLEGSTANGKISVQTSTGGTYPATLVGYDATADVAVIKVAQGAKGITPITFADSDALTVGSTAIVIGAPLGLAGTVTTGIVSALNRPIQVQSAQVKSGQQGTANSQVVALSAIQTDAAINQGNSGGALLDQDGNLVGLNDAIATSGDSTGNIGIGFAIPSNYVKRVAESIIATGKADHGYLGASLSDYNSAGSSFSTGAKVNTVVSGAAASTAGLKINDVITKIDNTVIESATQATAIVKSNMPGSTVKFTYQRDGATRTVSIKLGSTANAR